MGTFNGNIGTPSGGFNLKVDYSVSQSISGNYSTLTVTGYVKRNKSAYKPYNKVDGMDVTLTVNGAKYTANPAYDLRTDGYKKIISKSGIKVNHATDGTKTITIQLAVDGNLSNYYPYGNIKKNIVLPTIPRASTMTVPAFTMGSEGKITVFKASSSFTHTITANLGDHDATLATKSAATTISWTPPVGWADALPNANRGTATYKISTYSGTTAIGSKTYTKTMYVPSLPPKITGVSASEAVSGLAEKFGAFIQGKSKLNISTQAEGQYAATIKSVVTEAEGSTYSGSSAVTKEIEGSGQVDYRVTVTDSRGKSTTQNGSVNVLAYSNPTISKFEAVRCGENGEEKDDGTRIKIYPYFEITTLENKNDNGYEISYRKIGEEQWTVLISGNSYMNSEPVITDSIFDTDHPYALKLTVSDYFTSVSQVIDIPTAFTLVDYHHSGKGMAIGKVAQDEGMEIDMDIILNEDRDIFINTIDGKISLSDILKIDMETKLPFYKAGWIDPSYIEYDKARSITVQTETQLKNAPAVEGTDTLVTVAAGEEMSLLGEITEEGVLWYRAVYNGHTGYCEAENMS